ncbi:Glycosyl transferases group 1 [seawater metagenome]|uniref:Glycosyl transferases group 1 n=1 Tax=seawater metagenome TaxID=1561972 RepID=A0A5E8CI45_9ZZZZ
MKRILQVLPKLEMGGVENGTIDTAIILQKNSMVPFVASAGGKKIKELEEKNIQHFRLWLDSKNPIIIFFNSFILAIIIFLKRIDIVHARSRAPAWSAWLACKMTGATFLTTFHGFYSGYDNCIKRQYNKVMTWGKKIITPSKFMKEHLKKYYKIDQERIIPIYRGVITNRFINVNPKRIINLKQKYKIENEKVVTLPGRLTDWKGQLVFLEAIQKVKLNNIKYLIIGNGSSKYKNQLLKIINDKNLDVIIDSECNDIPALYNLSDIIISASTSEETFGRVSVEGQSAGKVVLATSIGGSLETIIDNKTGYFFEPFNSLKLAELIEMVIKNNINMKDEGKKNSQNFDISVFEKNILKVYNKI